MDCAKLGSPHHGGTTKEAAEITTSMDNETPNVPEPAVDETTGPLAAPQADSPAEDGPWAPDDSGVWADDSPDDGGQGMAERDPWLQPLLAVVLALVAALLVTTAAIYIYLATLNEAPRTVAEREIAAGEAAVEANPQDLNSLTALAYAYARAGRFNDALDVIDSAQSLDDADAIASAKADVLRISGRHSEAVDAYDEAEAAVRRLLVEMEQEQRKKGVVGPVKTDALLRVYWGRGLSKQALGDLSGAIVDLEAASRESSTQASVWVSLGDLYSRTQEPTRAAEAYNRALRFVPDLPEALLGLRRLEGGE